MRKSTFAGLKSGRLPVAVWLVAMPLAGLPFVPAAPRQPEQPQPVAVLENAALMSMMFEPLYGDLTRAVAAPPATRAAWRAVFDPAAKLAELHNLLYFRRDREFMERAEWRQHAASSQALMRGLVDAVRGQDYPAVRARYEAAVNGCNTCHQKFDSDAPSLEPYDPVIP